LFNDCFLPLIWPLEVCLLTAWAEREQYWIRFFKPLGRLVNGTDGGDGGSGNKGWKWSKEALEKVSKSRRERAAKWKLDHPGEYYPTVKNLRPYWGKLDYSKFIRKTIYPPEMYQRIAAKNRGKKRTPEQIERNRLARIGKKQNLSDEERERKRQRAKLYLRWPAGKVRPRKTEAQKEHMRKKLKGRKITWNTSSESNKAITAPLLRECNRKRKKPVIDNNGRCFESIAEACKALGVSDSGFRDALKHHWRCRGVYWKVLKSESETERETLCPLPSTAANQVAVQTKLL